jgi:hypothetical protein
MRRTWPPNVAVISPSVLMTTLPGPAKAMSEKSMNDRNSRKARTAGDLRLIVHLPVEMSRQVK